MILNDLLAKQNVFTKVVIKDGSKELSKELKVKVMRIRMAYNKARKDLDSELQQFMSELITSEFTDLRENTNRTPEEETRFLEMANMLDSEYKEFLKQKGLEEVSFIDDTFTLEEYSDILDVNSGNDVEINGVKIDAISFMEIFFELFVKED